MLSIRRKLRGEYFTADWLSTALVQNIEAQTPTAFVDLGAGRGSLLKAVTERWSPLSGHSVEIDLDNVNYLKKEYPEVSHHNLDVLNPEFPKQFKKIRGSKSVDLIVCNPPYRKVAHSSEVVDILSFLNLDKTLGQRASVEAEALFLIQALKAFPEGSQMAIILPDYILTAERARAIRHLLVNYFGVYKISEVPHKVFTATDVKTHVLFLRLGSKNSGNIDLSQISDAGNNAISISTDQFYDRGDYSYYKAFQSINGRNEKILLSDISKVYRGNLPMFIAKEKDLRPFHTIDFKNYKNNIHQNEACEFSDDENFRLTKSGDVLIGRVGRNAIKQIIYIESSTINYSDCIFQISLNQDSPIDSQFLIDELKSYRGQLWLGGKIKGSGAKSISLTNLLDFPIEIKGF
jgi:predicted RNA methylase